MTVSPENLFEWIFLENWLSYDFIKTSQKYKYLCWPARAPLTAVTNKGVFVYVMVKVMLPCVDMYR